MAISLLWFRRDLRLDDNPALHAALRAGAVVPVYVHAPEEEAPWQPGAASRAWLRCSLRALDEDLRKLDSRLVLCRGPSLAALEALLAQTGATAVHWNRQYEPAAHARDEDVAAALRRRGIDVQRHNASAWVEPWDIANRTGEPYRVFTPFWRTLRARLDLLPAAEPRPSALPRIAPPASEPLDALIPPSRPRWDRSMLADWQPGEAGAVQSFDDFLADGLAGYAEVRDRPDRPGTSRLSPHLHFGEISPRRILERVGQRSTAEPFLRQLGWREFATHLLHHFPDTPTRNLNPRFDRFAWAAGDEGLLDAWRRGRTGVPLVDAGMHELWQTGWMHNRVRMIAASFLTKHLRQHWLHGARWFWDTLVDADLANNTLGWQWVAGTGADAAPYFRVFNPLSQAEKFDPQGRYRARWLPAGYRPQTHRRSGRRPRGRARRLRRLALTPFVPRGHDALRQPGSTSMALLGSRKGRARADVEGRHGLASHGEAHQPDDDHRRADVRRPPRTQVAAQADRRALPRLQALPPEGGRDPLGQLRVGNRPGLRSGLASAPDRVAGAGRQGGTRTLG